MALSDLAHEIAARAGKMDRADRIKNIRDLVEESEENRKFIQEYLPQLYAEAFPSSSRSRVSATMESGSIPLQCAKR